MPSEARRRYGFREMLGRTSLPLVVLLVASMLGVASSTPAAEAQQQPTPARPLLLIGGTFVPDDFAGYQDPRVGWIPGWDATVDWLETEGGYTENVDLFIGEMAEPDGTPPGWSPQDWAEFVSGIEAEGGSVAGMAAMEDSVTKVRDLIFYFSTVLDTDIDVIAHSQAAAIARRAIQDLEAFNANPVHTMISLGGGNYGASSFEPAFQAGFGSLVFDFWADIFVALTLADCRDNPAYIGVLVCPDIIRNFSSPPDPDNPPPPNNLYVTNFYPNLNASGGDGPVPGDTAYVHLYSTYYETDGGEETQAGERIKLFPGEPNTNNLNVQEFCSNHPDIDQPGDYPVHHVHEWTNPGMRQLILGGLGIAFPNPSECLP